jgi:flagellar M-ring protein FliF
MSGKPVSKPSLLPPPVAAVAERARASLASLSRPAKILIASSTVLAMLFAAVVFYRETHEAYGILFSQLEQDDAAGIVTKLKELKVPYHIEAGGSTLEVPESKVAEIRMELASAGLPRGGGVGFESFDKMRLGATEFEQRVLYRRALEGELARTIGAIAAVQSARVHLVLPEKSVFVQRAEPASASILVHMRPGRTLGPGEVRGIVSLTASAVPSLSVDHVTVVTADGQMLKKPRSAGASDSMMGEDDQLAEQRALEAQLEDRARSLLEKVVGAGHVDVRVTAELDPARVERSEDHYDPSKTALRSEEETRERTGGVEDDTVGGVPGAASNLAPPPPPALPPPAASGSSAVALLPTPAAVRPAVAPKAAAQPFRESHTRNFEVDHVSEKRSVSAGALKRLGVAVIVDGAPHIEGGKRTVVPRDPADLERFTALVRSAVGANEARGDLVTVESVPFGEGAPIADLAAAADAAAPAVPQRPLRAYAPAAIAAALLLVVALVVARRRATRAAVAAPAILPAVVEVPRLESAESPLDLRARALERAAEDPATAALVLRFWLGTTDAEVKG